MGSWMNNDGLYVEFGPQKATPTTAGEFVTFGSLREIEIKLTLSALTETETVQSDTTIIPKGARIEEVELVTITAAATGTAVDVGLIKADRVTELDYNGLVAAEVAADMSVAGEKHVYRQEAGVGAGAGGALIGTTLAENGHITASRTTATAFTAGVIMVRVKFMVP